MSQTHLKAYAAASRSGDVRERREEAMVRRHLELLPDRGNAAPGSRCLEDLAREVNCSADELRAYRDGNSDTLSKSQVSMFATLLGRGDGLRGIDIDDSLGFADPSTGGWYGSMLSEESSRQQRLKMFHLIDKTRPEAHTALDAWADLGTTGQIGEDARWAGGFEPVVLDATPTQRKAIVRVGHHVNQTLLPDDVKWQVFRGMCKSGNQFGEFEFERHAGRWRIGEIAPRNPRTMYVHRDPKTGAFDPGYAYKQILPGSSPDKPAARFAAWEVCDFANTLGWGDLYGESLFDPLLRSYIQIESMEAAMIIRRLERASLKLKHLVDVGLIDGGELAVEEYLQRYRARHKKVQTVDNGRNSRTQRISLPPGEDLYIPVRDKESPADVGVMQGDAYIEEIADFLHFFNKWLSGLGVPKGHLNYEDAGSKTGVNDKHIVFARRVRRMQLKFIGGLKKVYWVSLILQGIDPREFRWAIFPPALGTRDELVRAQVMLAHATTCRYLAQTFGQTGKQPSVQWMLRHVMGFDDETIDGLELDDVLLKRDPGGDKNDPPAGSGDAKERAKQGAVLQANPFVLESIDRVRWMLDERALERRVPRVVDEMMRRTAAAPVPGRHFEAYVRGLGIDRLRRAA